MDDNPFYRRAAEDISRLINKRPWSPTVDEFAQIIEDAWWQSLAFDEEDIERFFGTPEKREAWRRRLRGKL
jgi:hypothetical protein